MQALRDNLRARTFTMGQVQATHVYTETQLQEEFGLNAELQAEQVQLQQELDGLKELSRQSCDSLSQLHTKYIAAQVGTPRGNGSGYVMRTLSARSLLLTQCSSANMHGVLNHCAPGRWCCMRA